MSWPSGYFKVMFSRNDIEYLCEILQPDINKGDAGALQMYWEFQAIINPGFRTVRENFVSDSV